MVARLCLVLGDAAHAAEVIAQIRHRPLVIVQPLAGTPKGALHQVTARNEHPVSAVQPGGELVRRFHLGTRPTRLSWSWWSTIILYQLMS